MKKRQYFFSVFLIALVSWMSVSCKKKVKTEALVPRTYEELPDWDEEDDDLPEPDDLPEEQ